MSARFFKNSFKNKSDAQTESRINKSANNNLDREASREKERNCTEVAAEQRMTHSGLDEPDAEGKQL